MFRTTTRTTPKIIIRIEEAGPLWRLSPRRSFERVPDPVDCGTPVRADPG